MQKLADYCLKRALKGSVRHAEMLLHYAEGKPAPRSENELFPSELPPQPPASVNAIENKSAAEIEGFREKLMRGEILEIPPAAKPN